MKNKTKNQSEVSLIVSDKWFSFMKDKFSTNFNQISGFKKWWKLKSFLWYSVKFFQVSIIELALNFVIFYLQQAWTPTFHNIHVKSENHSFVKDSILKRYKQKQRISFGNVHSQKWDLVGKVFLIFFYRFFVWCLWRQIGFILGQQPSKEPKNIEPRTALFDTYYCGIYLKLGYMNFLGNFTYIGTYYILILTLRNTRFWLDNKLSVPKEYVWRIGTNFTSGRTSPLWLVSSTTQTKSPVLRCCSAGVCHLAHRFNASTYSLIQRAQIVLAYDCARAYRLRLSNSSTRTIDRIAVAWLPSRKLSGVIAPRSDGSVLTGVNGRKLSVCSSRQKVLFKTSSVRRRIARMP